MTREGAIQALKKEKRTALHENKAAFDMAIKALEQEPKTGKWLYKEITNDYRVTGQCSECKERRIIDNFCSNCGAKMVEPRESEGKE